MAAVLAVALLAAACGEDDPTTTPTTSPVTTSTDPQTTTTAPAAEPEPGDTAADEPSTSATTAADPSEGAAPSYEGLRGEFLWSDVFDDSSASAQACIRESLEEEDLDAVLARPVTSDDFPTDDDVSMLACIGPERALDVFLPALVWSIQSDYGIVIGDEEMACMRESMADIDLIGMFESPGDSPEAIGAWAAARAVAIGLYVVMFGRCLGDVYISLMLADDGIEFEDLSDSEIACLRKWHAGADWDGWTETAEDPEAAAEEFMAWSLGWLECLPEQSGLPSVEAPSGVDDDHADWLTGATAVKVGSAAGGWLEYEDDVDFFVFEAVEGVFYELGVAPGNVALGKLMNPTVALYDADGFQLDYDDDSGDRLAPYLFWSADDSGPLYVEVGGFGIGSYTLTVAIADVDDNHADSLARATEIEKGVAVDGVLDYGGDVDFFVFEAIEGVSYELSVWPRTLEDPTVTLYDADGFQLDYDDDSGGLLASRLYRRAASTGPLYVGVGGYGTGSYTLMITYSP